MNKKWLLTQDRVSEILHLKFGGAIAWMNERFNLLSPDKTKFTRIAAARAVELDELVTLAQLQEAGQNIDNLIGIMPIRVSYIIPVNDSLPDWNDSFNGLVVSQCDNSGRAKFYRGSTSEWVEIVPNEGQIITFIENGNYGDDLTPVILDKEAGKTDSKVYENHTYLYDQYGLLDNGEATGIDEKLSVLEQLLRELITEKTKGGVRTLAVPFSHTNDFAIANDAFKDIPIGAKIRDVVTYVSSGSNEYDKYLEFALDCGSKAVNGIIGTEGGVFNNYEMPRATVTNTVMCILDSTNLGTNSQSEGYIEVEYILP